jgi:hypothetical protein
MSKSKFILLLLLVNFLTGCVNLDAVGKFADGASILSKASSEFYTSELETDRKLAGMTIDLAEPVTSAESPWLKVTKGENLIAEARRNKAAVMALAAYANNLKNIADFDNDDAVEKSANKLSRNLNSLSKELDSSIDLNESALATAFTKLASLYTDVKTRAIIREKVKLAHPFVTIIVETMIKDIERQQTRFLLTRLTANVNRENWFNAFKQDVESGTLSASQTSLISIAAGQLVEDELEDKLSELPTRNFLKQLKKTATSCLAAHKAIRDTDLKDDAKELVEFIGDASKLVNAVLDIK